MRWFSGGPSPGQHNSGKAISTRDYGLEGIGKLLVTKTLQVHTEIADSSLRASFSAHLPHPEIS